MTGTANKNPFEQLGDLIADGNTRTLVINGKDRTIASLPFGYAVLIGIALLMTAAPVLVVALVILHYTGGSLAIEDSAPAAPPAQPTPETQMEGPISQA
jgi:hypothetical protein